MIEAVVLDPNQELMMRFLVGEATDAERDAVEQRFITDSGYFDELCALEHEMLLALVHHRLPARWAKSFAAAVSASPDRQRRLEEVRDLAGVVGRETAPPQAGRIKLGRTPWLQAAALLALLA
mgnify:CR=1 FL=1